MNKDSLNENSVYEVLPHLAHLVSDIEKVDMFKGISGHLLFKITAKGKGYFLKVFHSTNDYENNDLYESEIFILEALKDYLPLPKVLTTGRRNQLTHSPFILTESLPGVSIQNDIKKGKQLTLNDVSLIVNEAVEALLKLRDYASSTTLKGIYPNWVGKVGNVRKFTDLGIDRELRKLKNDPVSNEVREMADLLKKKMVGEIKEYKYYLCHGDFTTKNIIVDGNSLSGFIDWEFAYWGALEKDISDLLVSFIRDTELDPNDLHQLFIQAFESNKLISEDIGAFALFRFLNSINNLANEPTQATLIGKFRKFYNF